MATKRVLAALLVLVMAASGLLVKWFAEVFAPDLGSGEDRYARLDAEAAPTPPGADGLVVLPYFLGEKTPIFDADARGMARTMAGASGRVTSPIPRRISFAAGLASPKAFTRLAMSEKR